jgi:phosphate transport system substrate-binding protein
MYPCHSRVGGNAQSKIRKCFSECLRFSNRDGNHKFVGCFIEYIPSALLLNFDQLIYMKRFIIATTLSLLSACATASNTGKSTTDSELQGTLKIGGSSETMVVLERLSTAYQAQTEGVEIQFFPPSQTSGGIQGIKGNLLDIGAVSREIEPEAGEALQYIALTQTPLAFIVHESVTGVNNLTQQDIQAIYQGKIRNWQELGWPGC